MRVKGIKRGQAIELLEQLDTIPDGTEIIVELKFDNHFIQHEFPTAEVRLARLNQLFGVWSSQPEIEEIFAEIDRERHADQGRVIDPLEN